jgi:hypothetical protein
MTLSLDATVGQFPLTGTSTSEEVESTQSTVDGESHIVWQHASVVLTGATAETIITIRPTNADPAIQNSARKQNRWYLDNIKVSKYEGPLPTPSTKPGVIASFPFAYDTTFDASTSTVEGMWDLAQGWILSEGGTSKLSSHLADGSALKVTYKYEAAASDGTKDHVRVLATGMPKDGYWLFEVPVKDAPAGTYNITYKHSASATGPNYFLVEVSVDGQNWQPAGAQTTSETFKDGTSPRDVTWTYALNKGGVNAANVAHVVDLDFAAPALPGINTVYIRAKIADDMAYGSTKAMGGSGTNRIWGPCQVTLR